MELAQYLLDMPIRLWVFIRILVRTGSLKIVNTSIYGDVEKPLITILAKMEHVGVMVDRPYLESMSETMHSRLLQLEEAAYAHAGMSFNLASPKQLQEVLYGNLGLEILEKTPTGQPSTSEAVYLNCLNITLCLRCS